MNFLIKLCSFPKFPLKEMWYTLGVKLNTWLMTCLCFHQSVTVCLPTVNILMEHFSPSWQLEFFPLWMTENLQTYLRYDTFCPWPVSLQPYHLYCDNTIWMRNMSHLQIEILMSINRRVWERIMLHTGRLLVVYFCRVLYPTSLQMKSS